MGQMDPMTSLHGRGVAGGGGRLGKRHTISGIEGEDEGRLLEALGGWVGGIKQQAHQAKRSFKGNVASPQTRTVPDGSGAKQLKLTSRVLILIPRNEVPWGEFKSILLLGV